MNSGRRVRAAVIATALAGSALSAVALGTVASANPALAAPNGPAPVGSQYPTTWTVSGNVATGTTPSGVVVTATLTAPAAWFSPSTGPLVFTGPTPGYLPATTTQALLPEITGCGGLGADLAGAPPGGPSCGSVTYSFSRPVMAPVLYVGDIGTGSIDAGVFTAYHDSPLTLAAGTFSLASADSETPNTSISNGGATVGITNPSAGVGLSGVDATSCGTFGCGAYDIATTTPTITSLTLNYGYAGTGTSEDVFSQVLAITPSTPALTLHKSVSPSVAAKAGVTVTYSYLITNTGNVTLTDVHPQDTSFSGTGTPSPISCPAALRPSSRLNARPAVPPSTVLDPGQSETCTDTYKLTQADADAGKVTNTATATGTPPSGPTVTSAPSSATVTIPDQPLIVIIKTASPKSLSRAGDTVRYHFLVSNTGNVTLTGIKVNDRLPGLSAIACPSTTLTPDSHMTCTASYRLTQANVNAGKVINTASTTGTPPSGPPVTSAPSSATVTIAASPALVIDKSASPGSFDAAGSTIHYSFLVTNTGNVTLTGVRIIDLLSGVGPIACPSAALNPGHDMTCTAAYVTTKQDLQTGSIANTATATGDPPTGSPVVSGPSTVVITAPSPAPVHRGTPVPVTG
jgi:uncharacterized repeat protein (TIGR01451 family)